MAKAESDFAPVCGRSAGLRYNRSGRQSGLVSGAVFKTVRRLLKPLVCSIRTVFRQFLHSMTRTAPTRLRYIQHPGKHSAILTVPIQYKPDSLSSTQQVSIGLRLQRSSSSSSSRSCSASQSHRATCQTGAASCAFVWHAPSPTTSLR